MDAMAREFTSDDHGKNVVTAEGDRLGTISDVREGRAHIERDENTSLTEKVKSMLGWNDSDDTHELQQDHVDRVDENEVRLRQP